MVHVTYIQSRRPGWSKDDFTAMWREHYELAKAQPGFWAPVTRYVQNDVLDGLGGEPGVAGGFDGVGELFFASDSVRAAIPAADRAVLREHSSRFFGTAGLRFVGSTVLRWGRTEGWYKLMVFLRGHDGVSGEGAGTALTDALRESALSDVNGCALSVASTEASDFSAVVSVWVSGPNAARAVLASDGWRLRCGAETVREDTLVLLGRENVLMDRAADSVRAVVSAGT